MLVDTGTYTHAATLLVDANQDAAAVAEALFDAIGQAAQSTGTTPGAATWADAYTTAAEQLTNQLSGLIDALGNTTLLLDATGHNHARAEAAAAPYGLPTYALPQRPLASVRMNGLPPIYGGNTDQPFGWHIILSHLAGYTWPGADLNRLAALAAAWHTTATGLHTLTAWPQQAAHALATMTSPELPAAIGACQRLAQIAHNLADDCDTLGGAVTAFTTEVQHQRDPIRSILIDLAKTIGLCELGGGLATTLTGPLGEWAGNTYAATRITRAAGRIIGLLAGLDETLPRLRPLLTGTDTTADTTWLTTLAHTHPITADIRATNNLLMNEEATTSGAAETAAGGGTAQRGSMTEVSVDRLRQWEESSGSHTLERHVGRTEEQLAVRVSGGRAHASTFPSLASASESITQTLQRNESRLREWLRGSGRQTRLTATFDDPVGTVVNESRQVIEGHKVRVVVRRDPSDPYGFRVLTAYVDP